MLAPFYWGETTKVCVQPLPLRPLPVEEDSPHHVSRFVGRLRDWSKSKLLDAQRGVNPTPKTAFSACVSTMTGTLKSYAPVAHRAMSNRLHVGNRVVS